MTTQQLDFLVAMNPIRQHTPRVVFVTALVNAFVAAFPETADGGPGVWTPDGLRYLRKVSDALMCPPSCDTHRLHQRLETWLGNNPV
jgi:hypothetical protein